MWFGNVSTSTGRRGEIFIEENIRATMRSLSQLSMMEFENFFEIFDTPSKGHP